jgi:hypothetical protein
MNAPYSNCSQENPRKACTAEALFVPSFRPDPVQPRLFDATAGAIEHAQRADRAEGAGLVTSKTSHNFQVKQSGEEFLINLDRGACRERRVKRMKRSVHVAGTLHSLPRRGFRPEVPWFITLTYAQADAWEPKHISKALERYDRWCRKHGVPNRNVWVAEIQQQRASNTGKHVVHYHLMVWLPYGVSMPKWDEPCGRRHAFWSHGMTNRQVAKSGVGYLMKYLGKMGEFTDFPKGLRLCGTGGHDGDERAIRSWTNLPEWVKCAFGVGDVVRKHGRLVVQATGEVLSSPYTVLLLPGAIVLYAVGPIPERRHVGPYSTFPRQEEAAFA